LEARPGRNVPDHNRRAEVATEVGALAGGPHGDRGLIELGAHGQLVSIPDPGAVADPGFVPPPAAPATPLGSAIPR
jgi:hypothetical protein